MIDVLPAIYPISPIKLITEKITVAINFLLLVFIVDTPSAFK
jgi:hypothetical protein